MSLTTLKRKTDGSYHVSGGPFKYGGKGYVNHISSGRPAFRLNGTKHNSRPKQVCACPVVQQMTPLDGDTYVQQLNAIKINCENTPQKSGDCNLCYGTFVQEKDIDYEQYLKRKHGPLPRGQEHYPPMVPANSVCRTNFSFLDFIKRLSRN